MYSSTKERNTISYCIRYRIRYEINVLYSVTYILISQLIFISSLLPVHGIWLLVMHNVASLATSFS